MGELWHSRVTSNWQLLRNLRGQCDVVPNSEGSIAGELLASTIAAAAMHRVEEPRALAEGDVPSDMLLHPRLGIAQEKDDGRVKLGP